MVTTEEPVFSTALVMNDLCEYVLFSLNLGLVNGPDIIFEGHIIPIVIAEDNNNFLCL